MGMGRSEWGDGSGEMGMGRWEWGDGNGKMEWGRTAEPHSFLADPDPAVFLNADPDPGPA